MTGIVLKNLAEPAEAQDAATKSYVDNGGSSVQLIAVDTDPLANISAEPFPLLEGAGPTKVIVVRSASFFYFFQDQPFANDKALSLVYGAADDADTGWATSSPVLFNTGTDNEFATFEQNGIVTDLANVANKGIFLTCGEGDIGLTGSIDESSLDDGGLDYEAADVFTLVDDAGVGAAGVVDTVDGEGAIVTYHLTNNGTGYSPGNATVTGGAGSGGTISVDSIVPLSNSYGFVAVDYYVVDFD